MHCVCVLQILMSAASIMDAVSTAVWTHRVVMSVCVLLERSSTGTRKTVLVSVQTPLYTHIFSTIMYTFVHMHVCVWCFHGDVTPCDHQRWWTVWPMASRRPALCSAALRWPEWRRVLCPVRQTPSSRQVSVSAQVISHHIVVKGCVITSYSHLKLYYSNDSLLAYTLQKSCGLSFASLELTTKTD